jgi:hypothetical protein
MASATSCTSAIFIQWMLLMEGALLLLLLLQPSAAAAPACGLWFDVSMAIMAMRYM